VWDYIRRLPSAPRHAFSYGFNMDFGFF